MWKNKNHHPRKPLLLHVSTQWWFTYVVLHVNQAVRVKVRIWPIAATKFRENLCWLIFHEILLLLSVFVSVSSVCSCIRLFQFASVQVTSGLYTLRNTLFIQRSSWMPLFISLKSSTKCPHTCIAHSVRSVSSTAYQDFPPSRALHNNNRHSF